MNFYVPKGCTLYQRKSDNRWEARIMINGKQKHVACGKVKTAVYNKLMIAYQEKKSNPIQIDDRNFTLFSWLDNWHRIYRMPKKGIELSENTIIMDLSMIRKIKRVFKDKRLRDVTAIYIQDTLNTMGNSRTTEGVYTLLKLALKKAKDIVGRNIMENVDRPKHERVRGRSLTKYEVNEILSATQREIESDIIKFYIYTGCRVSELTRVFIKHINLERNEIFIDGTKTKGSKRSMPIMPPLRPILEKLTAGRDDNEKLFNFSYPKIQNFYRKIKKITGISFMMKDLRHTAATNFKDAGIPSSVFFRWFGWADDYMAKTVYVHVTNYEMKVSQEWAAKFE